MMIPITRKEKYINEIVGGGDTAPKTPQTREEFFFADILGEVIAPSPVTRVEKYLSVIAGQYSGELPEPVTRIEKFIARAAGMDDVTIPTPITREEIFWSNYSAIVDFEVEGVPPLTYKTIEGTLKNYRIYGQTVDGESVGDRTGNLFDMKKFAELCYPRYASVTFADNTLSFTSAAIDAYVNYVCDKGNTVGDIYRPSCIDVLPSTTYTISMSSMPKCYISWIDNSYKGVRTYTRVPVNQSSYTFTTPSNCTKLLIRLGKEVNNIGDEFTISNIMLNTGSTALPYEPYGYRIPVTVSNGTDTQTIPIYLTEQIRKVGDEAEYIEYTDQKLHRIGAEDIDVVLPELLTLEGTNVLSVGTAVQPSKVYIKGEKEREYT